MKSQVAIEYMVIISFAFVILVPLIAYVNGLINDYNDSTKISLARNTVIRLGESADWVYSQGSPAQITLEIYIPSDVTNSSIFNNTILLSVDTTAGISQIYYNTLTVLDGTIPNSAGQHLMSIIAYDDYVNISWVR